MKRILLSIFIVLVFILSGCSGAAPEVPESTAQPAPTFTAFPRHPDALKRDAFESYTARFNVNFDGPAPWKYQLVMKKSTSLYEVQFHVEGVQGQENLGDVRLVTDGETSWMIGPGTDNECIQFPTNSEFNPKFVYPEDLITLNELSDAAKFVREEPFTGQNSLYYLAGPVVAGDWINASLEYHQAKDSEALLQLALLATGEDKIYGTGSGTIMATYSVDSLDNPAIEPVTGCEISLPLPDTAHMFVRIPGMASFESAQTAEEITAFYQEQLRLGNWTETEPAGQSESAVVLSYARAAENVELRIMPGASGGSRVEMFFFQAQ